MTPALSLSQHGLFLDVDGTLIDIAPSPEAVVVPPALVESLQLLERRLSGALALVSGRPIQDLDRLFAPLRLRASGVHGAELRFDPDQPEPLPAAETLPAALWVDVQACVDRFPGTFAEDKAFSFAVHYRAVPAVGPDLRAALEAVVARHAPRGLQLMPGHFVFEIKPSAFDKGGAIARLLEAPPFRGRRPVFLGDDITDLSGFATASARGGLAYSVGALLPGASGSFTDPAAVRGWLSALTHEEIFTA